MSPSLIFLSERAFHALGLIGLGCALEPAQLCPSGCAGSFHLSQSVDGFAKGRAGDVVGLLAHSDVVSRLRAAVIGNAREVLPCGQ